MYINIIMVLHLCVIYKLAKLRNVNNIIHLIALGNIFINFLVGRFLEYNQFVYHSVTHSHIHNILMYICVYIYVYIAVSRAPVLEHSTLM